MLSGLVLELVAHAHDLAVSTDHRQRLDRRVAESAHPGGRAARPARTPGSGGAFVAPVPAPPDATAHTRLAVFPGRASR